MNYLVAAIMATVFGAIMTGHLGRSVMRSQDRAVMMTASGEYQDLLQAVTSYIADNKTTLEETVPVGGYVAVSMATLESSQKLLSGFAALNPYGQNWVIYLAQPQAGGVIGIVESQGGSPLNLTQMATISGWASNRAGYIPPDGVMASLNSQTAVGAGGWKVSMTGLPNPGAGHFFAQTSGLAMMEGNSDALYRDAITGHSEYNTMNTTINMDGNNITKAKAIAAGGADATSNWPSTWAGSGVTSGEDVYANATIGAGVNGAVASYINSEGNGHVDNHFDAAQLEGGAENQYGDNTGGLKLANTYLYGDDSNMAVRVPGSFFIQHTGDALAADVAAVGNINSTGSIAAEGVSPTAGFPTAWGGGFHGPSTFAERYVGAGSNSTAYSWMSATGQMYADQELIIGTAAGASPGNSCSPNGALASNSDGSGSKLNCVNGVWSSLAQQWRFRAQCPTWDSASATITHTNSTADSLYSSNGDAEFISVTGTNSTYHNGYGTEFSVYVDGILVAYYKHQSGNTSEYVSDAVSFMVPYGSTWTVSGAGRDIPLICDVYQ
ncbi:shufflon system plasmid conjugative transfer pilus tip adhesin PilV [Gluconacetobacter diazotrophicus]|uniref:Shufflon system plasmid conjugative transfer pilus tip adhesin PilV n=1 Tax=Gluconacetobacter diazotrophicus TaxID=33996 RepID=A0A7W4I529_GLUDI|nr:shufflon system plasmid conjugative transfer pilus tip adhesin PilV [Gluconacetobacter diazotrophicus]MBB2156617.1 shufflon system plasmid conjugative transfer pilus tip adhesin PilV [Gluconacetobacter diazotrophicus]